MIHAHTLDGTDEDLIEPAFRNISFKDESAIITVSTHLRYAWTALPSPDQSLEGTQVLANFMRANSRLTDDERKAVPQNADVDTPQTPWCDQVYHHWNHVFWDVAGFLGELACTGCTQNFSCK